MGLLDTVSLDFTTSLSFGRLEEVALDELVFEDFVAELLSEEDGTFESAMLERSELSTETSETGEFIDAGKISAFSPAELNEPETGAQAVDTIPTNNVSKTRIDIIFFMSICQLSEKSPLPLEYIKIRISIQSLKSGKFR